MEQWKFGDHLRHSRERSGLSLVQAAQRLRIRPEILQAIECSDVKHMPPRTYARNMVAAYAKMLGLNPDEFCNMYLNELDRANQHAHLVQNHAEESTQVFPSGYEPAASRYHQHEIPVFNPTERIDANQVDRASVESPDDYRISSYAGRRSSQSSRRSHDSVNRHRSNRLANNRTDEIPHEEGTYNGLFSDRSPRRDRDGETISNPVFNALSVAADGIKNLIDSRRNNDVFAGEREGIDKKRIAIVGAIAVVVLLLAIMLISHGCSKKDSTSTMPVTAVEQANETAAKAPTSFKFEYSIDEGYEPWVEIYIDGVQEVAETMTGPASGSYDVTGTIELCSATTDGIHIKIDGVEQQLSIDESQGILDAQYDFKDILTKWETEHGVKSSAKNDTSTKKTDSTSSSNTQSNEATESERSNDQSSNASGEQAVNETTYDYSQGSSTYQGTTYEEPVYYNDGTATTGGY